MDLSRNRYANESNVKVVWSVILISVEMCWDGVGKDLVAETWDAVVENFAS